MKPRSFNQSLAFALKGIAFALRSEAHLRIHLAITVLVIMAGVWLGLTPPQWTAIILCIGLVLVSEMLNTALEKAVDMVTLEYHPLAEAVKNVAAGAVLVAVVCAVVCGLMVLGPPLLAVVRGLIK